MEITRRPATAADTELARQIHHRGYRPVVERQYGPWDEAQQDRYFESEWNPALFEIVVCDGVPCGRISVLQRDDAIVVQDIVILPEYQNRGIGARLLGDLLGRARAENRPVQLRTQRLNQALNLYLRLGFREIGRTPSHVLLEARPGPPPS